MPNLQLLCLSLLPWFPPVEDALAVFRQWHKSPAPELRIQALRSLRGAVGRDSRAALLTLLGDPHVGVRAAARAELGLRPQEEGPDLAKEIAALASPRARLEGLRALLDRKEDPSLFAADRDDDVRARALASGRVPAPLLREAWRHRDGRTRALALEGLGDADLAALAVRDGAEEVRIAAARVARGAAEVQALLADRSWRARLAAIRAAERIRSPETVPALIALVAGEPGRVRAAAASALEALTRAPFGEDAAQWRRFWEKRGAGYAFPEAAAAPVAAPHAEGESTSRVTIRFHDIPVVSRRACFVLDASRSMLEIAPRAKGRSRWDLSCAELAGVLDRLPEDARFNVVLFRTEVEAWKPRLERATRGSRVACRDWIGEAKPSGWTNLFDALALALADDEVDAIYLLTDGVPSRGAETARRSILDEIAFLNRFRLVQINCVQAGAEEGLSKAWKGFLDDLARDHDGVCVRE
ncbi:MAG: HEAT repeat domain-containing protein [Planctomycetaceae bacterium]